MMTVTSKARACTLQSWQITSIFGIHGQTPICLHLSSSQMYPTPQEKAVVHEAEKIMIETMARYDPSHDQYHGERNSNRKKHTD